MYIFHEFIHSQNTWILCANENNAYNTSSDGTLDERKEKR